MMRRVVDTAVQRKWESIVQALCVRVTCRMVSYTAVPVELFMNRFAHRARRGYVQGRVICEISDFRRDLVQIFALLGRYAA